MSALLVLYYSQQGSTRNLANKIAQGALQITDDVIIRQVPAVTNGLDTRSAAVPDSGDPYVTKDELIQCSGLALGSPTRFGNMAAAMKYFWDGTSSQWLKGVLEGKPACVFTSSSSMHGGQESTLLSMMLPLLHHGMIITGLPYSEPALHTTQSGGTPYGVSHVSGQQGSSKLSKEEAELCIAMGKRLALVARKLAI